MGYVFIHKHAQVCYWRAGGSTKGRLPALARSRADIANFLDHWRRCGKLVGPWSRQAKTGTATWKAGLQIWTLSLSGLCVSFGRVKLREIAEVTWRWLQATNGYGWPWFLLGKSGGKLQVVCGCGWYLRCVG